MFTHTLILEEEPNPDTLEALAKSALLSKQKKMASNSQLVLEDIEIFNTALIKGIDSKYVLIVDWKSKSDKY